MGWTRCSRSCSFLRACPWRPSASTTRGTPPSWRCVSSASARVKSVIARYSRPAMAGVWSDENRLACWLEVELAALDAWAELGVVPEAAARAIREQARPPSPERVAELEATLHHDTAAFVDAVAETLGPEGRWFHHGLTSSDVVDTALALQVREAGAPMLPGPGRAQGAGGAKAR